MSERDTVRDSPASKASRGAAPDEPTAPDVQAEASTVADGADGEKKFDPYRFQANTVPPGLRQEILAAKPPAVAELGFEDTLPPNVVISERRGGDDARADAPSNEIRVVEGRSNPTLIVKRPAGTRSLSWAFGVGAAILAFAVIMILAVLGTRTHTSEPATLPAVEVPAAEAPTVIAPPPTAVAPEHAAEARRSSAATRDVEPKVVGPTAHQARALPSVTAAQPRTQASARAGAFATPLAPPDK